MSEIRANTISDAAGTGPVTLTKQSAAKAWVNFDGTGTIAARDSLNVSSLTDNGTGDYLISYTNNMQSDDYAFSGAAAGSGNFYECWFGSAHGYPTVSNIGLGTGYDTPTITDVTYASCTVTGDLA